MYSSGCALLFYRHTTQTVGLIRQKCGFLAFKHSCEVLVIDLQIALRCFLTIEMFLRSSRPTTSKKYHLTQCIAIFVAVLDYKVQMACYLDFVNRAKVLIVHFLISEISAIVGKNFTGFAAKLIFKQSKFSQRGIHRRAK